MIIPKLHDVLFERGLTRADLARMTGLNKNWLGKLYRGKINYEHVASIQKICNVLNVKQSDIIEIVPDIPQADTSGVAAVD